MSGVRRPTRSASWTLLVLLALLGSGCAGGATGSPPAATATAPTVSAAGSAAAAVDVTTVDGVAGGADVFVPVGAREAPLVVLVPGGGWQTADRTGLRPLATWLAASGDMAVSASYRALADGVGYPDSVRDVACAVSFAVDRARAAGVAPTAVVLAGHSAGGHLAALAALDPDRYAAGCPYPEARPTALVLLAGAVDIRGLQDVTRPFFGGSPEQLPEVWNEGDPYRFTGSRGPDASLPVLLVHGTADDVVDPSSSERFALALSDGGHPVTLERPEGADHATVYSADVAGPLLQRWLQALPTPGP